MAANDILTRNVKTVFDTDWMYLLNAAGTIEGIAQVQNILALSDKEINTISNTGSGAEVAKTKLGVDFPLRTLISSDSTVTISQNTDEIDFSSPRLGSYRNIFIAAGAMIPQDTNGATTGTIQQPTGQVMNDFFDFAPGVDQDVQFNMMMPDEWDLGSIRYKFYWSAATVAGVGNVSWGISSVAISDGVSYDFNFNSPSFVSDTFSSATFLSISGPAAQTPENTPTLQDMIFFRIRRSGSTDSYTQDARLLGVAIQYKEGNAEPVEWT